MQLLNEARHNVYISPGEKCKFIHIAMINIFLIDQKLAFRESLLGVVNGNDQEMKAPSWWE